MIRGERDDGKLFRNDKVLYISTSCLCSPWMIQLSTAVDPLSTGMTFNLYLHYWLFFFLPLTYTTLQGSCYFFQGARNIPHLSVAQAD